MTANRANLREQAVKAVSWAAANHGTTIGLNLVVFLLLARLLDPEDIGLVALASVFTAFVTMFLDQGMIQALVQRPDPDPDHFDTAFWANVLFSMAMTVGGISLSGMLAQLFHEPRLAPIIAWLSPGFVLTALTTTQRAILRRNMDFRSLTFRSLIAGAAGGAAGIMAALQGLGVWSLVIKSLVSGTIGVLVLWRVSDWRPGLRVSKSHFKELFRFGSAILGIRITEYLNTRLFDALIGFFLGPVALGYYAIAFRVIRDLLQLFAQSVGDVAFPIFSRIQQDPERLRNALYKVTGLTSALAFPAFLGLAAVAPELLHGLFGAKWGPSVPVLQILAFAGLSQSVLQFNGKVLVALGRPGWLLALSMFGAMTNLLSALLVVQWGIVAVAAAYAFVRYPLATLQLIAVRRLLQTRIRAYLAQFYVPLLGSLAMLTVVLVMAEVTDDALAALWRLLVLVPAGAFAYLLTIQRLRPSLISESLGLVRSLLPRRG